MTGFKLILNPLAGRGQGERLLPTALDYLRQEGVMPDVTRTEQPMHALELAKKAVADGYDVILAMGGDGTTNEVINGIMAHYHGEPVGTLGIIPVGSGNDFCIGIKWPTEVKEACQRIGRLQRQLIDVGKIDGRYFVNAVGVGFDAQCNIEASKIQFSFLRGTPLYLLAVLRTLLFHYEAPMTTITYDDQVLTQPTLMTSVTNGPRYGGGFWVAPKALTDDGLFDLCIAGYVNRLGILRLIPHFLKGTHTDKKPIRMARARRVVLDCDTPLLAQVDGEMYRGGNHVEFALLPKSLWVLA